MVWTEEVHGLQMVAQHPELVGNSAVLDCGTSVHGSARKENVYAIPFQGARIQLHSGQETFAVQAHHCLNEAVQKELGTCPRLYCKLRQLQQKGEKSYSHVHPACLVLLYDEVTVRLLCPFFNALFSF